jgi:hypothetical protein
MISLSPEVNKFSKSQIRKFMYLQIVRLADLPQMWQFVDFLFAEYSEKFADLRFADRQPTCKKFEDLR